MTTLTISDLDMTFIGPVTYFVCFYSGGIAASVISLLFGGKELADMQRCILHMRGYRSKMSKKNLDTWNFAQHYAAVSYIKVATAELLITILATYMLYISDMLWRNHFCAVLFTVYFCLPLLIVRILTERALRKNFNKDGTKKLSVSKTKIK